MALLWQAVESASDPSVNSVATKVITIVLAIIGAIASAIEIYNWTTGKRKKRSLDKLLETLADEHDAEAARTELEAIRHTQDEIQRELPEIARRLYDEERRRRLAESIAEQVREYQAIAGGNSKAGIPLTPSAERLVAAEIIRPYEKRRIRTQLVTVVVTLATASILLPDPIDPSFYIRYLLLLPLAVAYPSGFGDYILPIELQILGLCLWFVETFALTYVIARRTVIRRYIVRFRKILVPVSTVAVLSVNAILAWANWNFAEEKAEVIRSFFPVGVPIAGIGIALIFVACGVTPVALISRARRRGGPRSRDPHLIT